MRSQDDAIWALAGQPGDALIGVSRAAELALQLQAVPAGSAQQILRYDYDPSLDCVPQPSQLNLEYAFGRVSKPWRSSLPTRPLRLNRAYPVRETRSTCGMSLLLHCFVKIAGRKNEGSPRYRYRCSDIGTDVGDAVCLAYLLAQPRCELLATQTVFRGILTTSSASFGLQYLPECWARSRGYGRLAEHSKRSGGRR